MDDVKVREQFLYSPPRQSIELAELCLKQAHCGRIGVPVRFGMAMSDLFTTANASRPKPLAAELRPSRLDDIVGQRHLLAPDTMFRKRVASGRIGSVVMFGPPGIGKTTIARAIGNESKREFRSLHPAHNKVEDIKAVAAEARDKPILVFVDEGHRYNAAQQDYLLSLTEEGVFDFILATSENPYFALTRALVSRSTIFELKPLTVEEMEEVVRRAIRHLQRKGIGLQIAPEMITMIAGRSSGDARRALNVVEGLVAGVAEGETVLATPEMVEEIYAASPLPYSRQGDDHYNCISAWIKSMRGSDPDATLYWLAKLIAGGEDPRFIARRLLIHASEDVGLADNSVLSTAAAALAAVQHVGYPEAQIILAHAALHIARAPKSNSACRGISLALEYVKSQPNIPVPPHLRDTHYSGAKELGYEGYQFPHDDGRGWVPQDYAPGVTQGQFYQSDGRGGATFEERADAYWRGIRQQDVARRF